MWFFNEKRADQVAQSISQLIHTLSDGRENHGPTGPERLLRELATLLSEDTIIGQRVVIDLHPSAVGQQARLLYAACKAMPNVVERRDFRWDR